MADIVRRRFRAPRTTPRMPPKFDGARVTRAVAALIVKPRLCPGGSGGISLDFPPYTHAESRQFTRKATASHPKPWLHTQSPVERLRRQAPPSGAIAGAPNRREIQPRPVPLQV